MSFIPARAGSKGIPNKNTAFLNGKPLISYTLDIAKQLPKQWYSFVSTDCVKVLQVAKEYGMDNGYIRPSSLASDESPTLDSLFHAIDWLSSKKNTKVTNVLLLQPTSPLRTYSEVNNAVEIFMEQRLESLISVHKMREHPFECIEKTSESWNYLRKPSAKVQRRQDYQDDYFFIDGSIYLASVNFLKKHRSFVNYPETFLYEVSADFNVDIDNPRDLVVAEALHKQRLTLSDEY